MWPGKMGSNQGLIAQTRPLTPELNHRSDVNIIHLANWYQPYMWYKLRNDAQQPKRAVCNLNPRYIAR